MDHRAALAVIRPFIGPMVRDLAGTPDELRELRDALIEQIDAEIVRREQELDGDG